MQSCSFCGKNQKEVKRLISGKNVNICDECIGLCLDMIKEEENKDNEQDFHLQGTLHDIDTPDVKLRGVLEARFRQVFPVNTRFESFLSLRKHSLLMPVCGMRRERFLVDED